MSRIVTINTRDLDKSAKEGGCGECQTSCGVANQACEKKS